MRAVGLLRKILVVAPGLISPSASTPPPTSFVSGRIALQIRHCHWQSGRSWRPCRPAAPAFHANASQASNSAEPELPAPHDPPEPAASGKLVSPSSIRTRSVAIQASRRDLRQDGIGAGADVGHRHPHGGGAVRLNATLALEARSGLPRVAAAMPIPTSQRPSRSWPGFGCACPIQIGAHLPACRRSGGGSSRDMLFRVFARSFRIRNSIGSRFNFSASSSMDIQAPSGDGFTGRTH